MWVNKGGEKWAWKDTRHSWPEYSIGIGPTKKVNSSLIFKPSGLIYVSHLSITSPIYIFSPRSHETPCSLYFSILWLIFIFHLHTYMSFSFYSPFIFHMPVSSFSPFAWHTDMPLECNPSTNSYTTLTPGSCYEETTLVRTFFLLKWLIAPFCPWNKHHTETFLSLGSTEFSTLIFCSLLPYPVSSQIISNFLSMFMPLRLENTFHSVELLLSSFCLMHYFILPDPAQMCCNLLGQLCLFVERIHPSLCCAPGEVL